jgi:hypothetical protein
MFRLHANGRQLQKRLYERGDGTLAYFFERAELENLFAGEMGYEVESLNYC